MNWLKRWWPALAWAAVISVLSTSVFAASETSKVIIPVLHWLFPRLSAAGLDHWHEVIRKCAHLVEYFILSILILRGIRGGRRESHLAWALLAILLVAAYASLDEFHQSFVPGRTPAVRDALLDTAGGAAAQAVMALMFARRNRKLAADSGLRG